MKGPSSKLALHYIALHYTESTILIQADSGYCSFTCHTITTDIELCSALLIVPLFLAAEYSAPCACWQLAWCRLACRQRCSCRHSSSPQPHLRHLGQWCKCQPHAHTPVCLVKYL